MIEMSVDRKETKQERKWKIAQEREKDYITTGKNLVWGTPHSLEFWQKFLRIDSLDGRGVEVGCGPNGAYKFASNVIGVDPIDFSYVCENFLQGVGEDLPFEDKSVDFVICCNTLDHCMDPQKVMSEMFRISNKVIVWVYVHPGIVGWIMKVIDKTHLYRFTPKDIYDFLEPYSCVITKKFTYTFFDVHLKCTKSTFASLRLLAAHILGVRALCIHAEIVSDECGN